MLANICQINVDNELGINLALVTKKLKVILLLINSHFKLEFYLDLLLLFI